MSPDFFSLEAPTLIPEAYNAYMEAWNRSFQASRVDRFKPSTPELEAARQQRRDDLEAKKQAALEAWHLARAQASPEVLRKLWAQF